MDISDLNAFSLGTASRIFLAARIDIGFGMHEHWAEMAGKIPGSLVENEDYYFNEAGLMVFTAAYHLKRGVCCGSACLHCPYDHEKVPEWKKPKKQASAREGNGK